MRKYVFFTMNIGGINGAEQYIHNKTVYLEQNGWQVQIFSGRREEILIENFRRFENLIHPALRFYPYCSKESARTAVISWICQQIDLHEGDMCIIESSNVISSLWGELVADKLKCRHLALIMQERHNYNATIRNYFEFKLQRHELAGIFDDSVSRMLNNPELSLRPDMRVRAFCSNVVQDCEDHFSHLFDAEADVTFGSIGRLEKPYVPIMMDMLSAYFMRHPDKSFNLLLIGGCADQKRVKEIQRKIEKCGNVSLIRTNAMYPIPRSLVAKVDLFISAAGSSVVTYYEKVPTVKIHPTTAEPMGIFGYDIIPGKNTGNGPITDRTLQDCIDQILNKTICMEYIADFEKEYRARMHTEFARQLEFGGECSVCEYYDTTSVQYSSAMYKMCSVICRVFGARATYHLVELIRKCVRGVDD